METIIIGGDARFEYLARLLSERGDAVGVYGREVGPWARAVGAVALGRADTIVMNCPPRADVTLADVLALASDGGRIVTCGPGHPDAGDRRIVDLWADETLQRENARLTAEGALASAMRASTRALAGMSCLVIGWGRIGRALTERLVALGAKVAVASRTAAGRNRAVERGAEAADTSRIADALPGRKLIFNTAPAMVLDAEALARADADAMLIDLASPPFGIDLRAAWNRGLRAWREPGLPGRYCPQSAAKAILNAMDRLDGRGAGA
ncbi:MAG: NAD(P)-binding domain-containing protein [Clostridia bacterium]|nr:NAD(P)-binding domain-containing protein [Clostridia bacterium]